MQRASLPYKRGSIRTVLQNINPYAKPHHVPALLEADIIVPSHVPSGALSQRINA